MYSVLLDVHCTLNVLFINSVYLQELKKSALLVYANKQDVKVKYYDLSMLNASTFTCYKIQLLYVTGPSNLSLFQDCLTTAQISQSLNLKSIKDHPYHIQPCCALSGEGSVK